MSKLQDVLNSLSSESQPVSEKLNPLMAEAVAEQAQERAKRLKAAIVALLATGEESVKGYVDSLRSARRYAKEAKESLTKVATALEYFKVTGNPLPFYKARGDRWAGRSFCQNMGVEVPDDSDPMWDVPADWDIPA